MGYLDNSTITVDAILTKKGRELLAQGRGMNGFNITRFALSDDEIDYSLWNPAHPLGSDYYGAVIENMPITEAVPDETQVMKYKLLTLPRGVQFIPYIEADKSSISLTVDPGSGGQTGAVSPSFVLEDVALRTVNISTRYSGTLTGNIRFNSTLGYHALLTDATYITMTPALNTTLGQSSSPTASPLGSMNSSYAVKLIPAPNTTGIGIVLQGTSLSQQLTADTGVIKSTKLIVTAIETGGRVVIPITIKPKVGGAI